MASATMFMPLTSAATQRTLNQPISKTFFNPLSVRPSKAVFFANPKSRARKIEVQASLKDKALTGLTAAALTASMVIPEVAEAAVSPSLNNFLLSIAAGGVVLVALVGAVIGVSNFDPVKRS